jgi:hypothetical protein
MKFKANRLLVGFLRLVNCKVPIPLAEFAEIKQDFEICDRYKSGIFISLL